jgi:hypothetical protein
MSFNITFKNAIMLNHLGEIFVTQQTTIEYWKSSLVKKYWNICWRVLFPITLIAIKFII